MSSVAGRCGEDGEGEPDKFRLSAEVFNPTLRQPLLKMLQSSSHWLGACGSLIMRESSGAAPGVRSSGNARNPNPPGHPSPREALRCCCGRWLDLRLRGPHERPGVAEGFVRVLFWA